MVQPASRLHHLESIDAPEEFVLEALQADSQWMQRSSGLLPVIARVYRSIRRDFATKWPDEGMERPE